MEIRYDKCSSSVILNAHVMVRSPIHSIQLQGGYPSKQNVRMEIGCISE